MPEDVLKNVILIVDDETEYIEIIRNYLNNAGFKVLAAADGESAIKIASSENPDLILLDIKLPGIDGFDTCSQLKYNEKTKDIPVIFMTAFKLARDKVKGFEVGAVDYITKPIQIEELIARVNTHLKIRKLQKTLLQQNQRLQQEICERIKAEELLRQRTEKERLIWAIQERIRQSLKIDEILNTTVTQVRQFLQTDRVLIFQFEPDWSGLVVVESVSYARLSILKSRIYDPCFEITYIKPYQEGRIHAVEDIQTATLKPCYVNLLTQFKVRSNLVVPILLNSQTTAVGAPPQEKSEITLEILSPISNNCQLWGLLIAHNCSAPRPWQPLEIELLKQLSSQIGIAIQQAQLYQQLQAANRELQRLATIDGLTQVANRRQFDEILNREWQRLAQERLPLSLILCDIDFFKLYNDTYGHQAGDLCLQQVARALTLAVNSSNAKVARYGGEEFAVILPNTSAEAALKVANNILQTVRELKMTHRKSPISQYVSVSLGVSSTIPSSKSSCAILIAAADKALYQAKQEGRARYAFQPQAFPT